ncbi:MAG: NarK/NasA family nitrate transporter [Actinomycetota bacterium]|nr:NarK/NasA family nitrate transporter [Actinomycetota bacterium]
MTSTAERATTSVFATTGRRERWIEDWRPEDPAFWDQTGRRIARRNLLFSIFCEHIGFSIWVLWSVFVLFLPGGQYGISTDALTAAGQKFLLTSLPAGLGSAVRIPYTLAVARFGGRNWTVASALLLLVPTVLSSFLLTPSASFATMMLLAALTGLGGGNFASSMANINSFYPQRLKGWALGLNAGGGNLGVAVVQLVGLAVLATAGATHPRVLLAIYIPLAVLAALGAYLTMDNLSQARNDTRAMREACKDPNTWIMSFLYIGTFGSFIGFGFAFGQVLSTQFPTHFFGMKNTLSTVAATHTPISDALFRTTWFKNATGTMYWDLVHHKAVSIKSLTGWVQSSVINPVTHKATVTFTSPTTHQSIHVLTSKLDPVTYNPNANAAAAAVRIGHKVDPVKVAYLTFLGPLIGSLVRPIGGALADRFGGARTTFLNFAGMVLCGVLVLVASLQASLPLFMVAFIALFVLSGIGNGSTYKMIPTIFRSKAQAAVADGGDPAQADLKSRRLSGALIGIAGAIGAFGGVLVNIAFRQSFLSRGNGNAAYVAFIAFYLACAALTWVVYLRRSSKRLAGV